MMVQTRTNKILNNKKGATPYKIKEFARFKQSG